MRILIALENTKIANKIKIYLVAEGFDVDIAAEGETALWYVNEGSYSIIILDILLEKVNGLDVCHIMRKNGISTPILMLTNKVTIDDEIDALETGVDDFIRIPFSTPLFIARVRALLRRSSGEINNIIKFGSLCYNQKDRKCLFDKQEVLLTGREGKVLELLILAEAGIVAKQTLINQVWGVEFNGDPNIVDVYIGYLRRKIPGNPNNDVLQTVRGIGYRLAS